MRAWQRALVTGASSGIGAAIARRLANEGVDLILVGRDVDALESTRSAAAAAGVEAEVVTADLAADDELVRVVAAIDRARPPVDLLVNNAGFGQAGPFVDLPIREAVEVVRVNAEAVVRLTHAALIHMKPARRGAVVVVSSTAAAGPGPGQAVYAATKAFVASFGQAIHEELRGTGITCTTVLPGYTRTSYFERAGVAVDVPERRWMTADEVAQATLEAARLGRPLVVPGRRNRWRLALATPFPSLLKGRTVRLVRRARSLRWRPVMRRRRA